MNKRVSQETVARLCAWMSQNYQSLNYDTKASATQAAKMATKELGAIVSDKLIATVVEGLGLEPFWKQVGSCEKNDNRFNEMALTINALEERIKRLEELLK